MELLNAIKDTPIPSLLVIGGLLFLFVGIATIKKPIVIEMAPSSRKTAILLGVALLIFGTGLYLLPEQASVINTPTDTAISPALLNTDETQTLASSMPDPKKYYLIRSVQTQKVLTAENSALIQSDWVSDSNQKWFFEPLDGIDAGYYRIHSAFTGNCLDVYDSQLNEQCA